MTSKDEELQKEIPEVIYDSGHKISYQRGRFFGKGGFAKCYEITEVANGAVYAGKIVSKKLMAKHNQREKMSQEIAIHRSLNHKHVVGFKGFFEDDFNIYIILELCRKRSMMELHKRRKALTEPETRFYMKQILDGVHYLHENRIIHRDLKLGNLFLNDDLQVKIGDFGLATKIEYDGERKKTLCGTPNYIAPEILNKKGHSFEVDVWSIGCIMYTLLIGKPPFETSSLKETYSRIKKCEYRVPQTISLPATNMIVKMLQSEPRTRPKIDQLIKHEFFHAGYLPASLPASCLTMAPRFDQMMTTQSRKPLSEMNSDLAMHVDSPMKGSSSNHDSIAASGGHAATGPQPSTFDARRSLLSLRDQLAQLLRSKTTDIDKDQLMSDEMTDPAAQPLVWVSKWVDYSDKYGFGYQLCDDSVGVMFNDTTKLIMLANGVNVHYITREGTESYMTVSSYPKHLEKKMKLLSYFHRYMREHLMKAGATVAPESDQLSRIPHLYQWCRTTSTVIMQLTNGTLQLNFLDHTKIMLCPLMSAVTFIDSDKSFRTFRFSTLEQKGCSKGLYRNLRYAYDKINMLLEK